MLLDAHVDTNDEYYGQKYFHGTPFRRAVEEGLIDPQRSIMAGMRGSTYDDREWEAPREMGMEVIPCDELRSLAPAEYGAPGARDGGRRTRVPLLRHRRGGPGLSHRRPARRRLPACCRTRRSRSCARWPACDFCAFDVVEVSPQLDGPAQPTAMLAANVMFEMLGLRLLRGRGRG